MVPGTILFDRRFRFHDGAIGEKLFVVLNDGRSGTYITVKTTSQDARYGVSYGCQVTARFPHFFLPRGSCCLNGHTWLCLDEFYELDAERLIRQVTNMRINRIGVLPEEVTREIQGCAISCDDISRAQADRLLELWAETQPKKSDVS
jgi:hypothetical protein